VGETARGVVLRFGVAGSGALFEAQEIDRIVADAARAGITISDDTASTLEGVLSGTPSGNAALHGYPAAQQPALTSAVHDGFLSALGTTMALSFAIVVVGILIALALIRR